MPGKILHNKHALLPLLATGAFVGSPALAQDNAASAQKEQIETVVVVGAATDTEITPEQLDKQQANDLSDVFRHIPSVSVGGSLGIAQKVYIRGMEDTLLNITVDGAPQTGTLFHHIGRVSIEPELLQKVEVQSGAGEATSGAGAIGGAIRFKTKDAKDMLAPGQQVGALVKGAYFSNNGKKASASAYAQLTDGWGLIGSFVRVERENMEDGAGNEISGTAADQSLAFAKLNGQLSENQKITFSAERREESGDFGQRPNWPAREGEVLYPIDGERQTFVLNHNFAIGELVDLETTVYRTESEIVQDVFDRWGKYGASVESLGFDIRNTSRLGSHSVTYGVDLRQDEVQSRYLTPPSTGVFREEGQVMGAYVQDHWQVNSALLLSFGLRYDDYQLEQVTYDDETDSQDVSPNLGLSYALSDTVTLTLGHARAVRGKEVGDAFTLETAPGEPSLAPDLSAENVGNTELGIEYGGSNLALKAAVYQTTIDDVIMDQQGRGLYYENIGELEARGFELTAAYDWNNWYLSAAYSHNDSELNGNPVEGYEHNGLANSRGDTWSLAVDYAFSSQLELGWNLSYVQDLNDIEVLHRSVQIGWIDSTRTVDKPGYQVHDVYLRWKPLDSLTVNFAVQNLLDEHYRDHSSVSDYNHITGWEGVAGLYEPGRDIRLSADYRF